jgi:hypothetical protein
MRKNEKCIKYSNTFEEKTFCQYDSGWSGKCCHIENKCTCSSDLLCLGISAINNRSIYIFVLQINFVRDIFLLFIIKHVKMVMIEFPMNNFYVFVQKDIMEIDVK